MSSFQHSASGLNRILLFPSGYGRFIESDKNAFTMYLACRYPIGPGSGRCLDARYRRRGRRHGALRLSDGSRDALERDPGVAAVPIAARLARCRAGVAGVARFQPADLSVGNIRGAGHSHNRACPARERVRGDGDSAQAVRS